MTPGEDEKMCQVKSRNVGLEKLHVAVDFLK